MTTTSASQTQDFHASFQQLKRDVIALLESPQPVLSDITSNIASMKSGLAEVLPTLPKYDQAKYSSDIAELEKRLSNARAKNNPKSKFSFKRGPAPTASLAPVSEPPTKGENPALPSTSNSTASASTVTPPSAAPVSGFHLQYREKFDTLIRPSEKLTVFEGGYTLSLEGLIGCLIDLRRSSSAVSSYPHSRPTALHVRGLSRCVLIAPPDMVGSVLLHDVQQCVLVLGAQQFRMHTSHATVVLLNVASHPIIEHCSGLQFGPYPPTEDLAGGNAADSSSKHHEVQDFDCPGASRSSNWDRLELPSPAFMDALSGVDGNNAFAVKNAVERTLGVFHVDKQDA